MVTFIYSPNLHLAHIIHNLYELARQKVVNPNHPGDGSAGEQLLFVTCLLDRVPVSQADQKKLAWLKTAQILVSRENACE